MISCGTFVTAHNAEQRWAADSSVAIASVDGAHPFHVPCRERALATRPALAGHAYFEAYSVLTRLPGASRVAPVVAARVLERAFPVPLWLDPAGCAELTERLGTLGIAGGAVYDALVGEAARTNGHTLLTRDRRALRTYDRLGVAYEVVGEPQ
jgi:predicted nucleic acid-binding protein